MSSPSIGEHANAGGLTKRSMQSFRDHYVPAGHDLRDPLLSPLFGRLDGLPPALVLTAEFDPLRDEGEAYADRLAAASVPTERFRYDGMIHAFFGLSAAFDASKDAMQRVGIAVRRAFGTLDT